MIFQPYSIINLQLFMWIKEQLNIFVIFSTQYLFSLDLFSGINWFFYFITALINYSRLLNIYNNKDLYAGAFSYLLYILQRKSLNLCSIKVFSLILINELNWIFCFNAPIWISKKYWNI